MPGAAAQRFTCSGVVSGRSPGDCSVCVPQPGPPQSAAPRVYRCQALLVQGPDASVQVRREAHCHKLQPERTVTSCSQIARAAQSALGALGMGQRLMARHGAVCAQEKEPRLPGLLKMLVWAQDHLDEKLAYPVRHPCPPSWGHGGPPLRARGTKLLPMLAGRQPSLADAGVSHAAHPSGRLCALCATSPLVKWPSTKVWHHPMARLRPEGPGCASTQSTRVLTVLYPLPGTVHLRKPRLP